MNLIAYHVFIVNLSIGNTYFRAIDTCTFVHFLILVFLKFFFCLVFKFFL